MNKRTLDLLEKVFEAEIAGLLPYQTKAKLAQEMCGSGLLEFGEVKMGAVTVSGYSLTHKGRMESSQSKCTYAWTIPVEQNNQGFWCFSRVSVWTRYSYGRLCHCCPYPARVMSQAFPSNSRPTQRSLYSGSA